MKKIMLLACGFLIALTMQKMYAQQKDLRVSGIDSDAEIQDTVVVKMKNSDKIIIIGESLKLLSSYTSGDSLKTFFITDWDKAISSQSISIESKHVHYFVHASGKRRLKAENQDYMESAIDVAKEVKRLDLDLPQHQYFIHDLISGVEIQIYLTDPTTLKNELGAVSLNEALITMASNKKELNKNYKIELSMDDKGYKKTGKYGSSLDAIELSPLFGVGMIGSQVSPLAGFDINLLLADKYYIPKLKFGLEVNVFGFAQMNNADVVSVSPVTSIEGRCLFNLNYNRKSKVNWFGINAGIFKDNQNGSLNKAWKVGLMSEGHGPFNYGFDIIRDNNSKSIYSLKLTIPF